MTKRIYISDVHISSADAITPATGKPYGWLGAAHAQRLADFLHSPAVHDTDQLFIVGDFVDLWTCPIDQRPTTFAEIMKAPHNQPIVDAMAELRRAGKGVFYLGGNHDMNVDDNEVQALLGTRPLREPFRELNLFVEHGHEHCLFNATDPRPDFQPYGYFITRLAATASNRGHQPLAFDLWTILESKDKVIALLDGSLSVGRAVFDVCMQKAGVGLDEQIIMPSGSTVAVADVREMYAACIDDWSKALPARVSPRLAIACEWDPYYGLPDSGERLSIVGHSHKRTFAYANEKQELYINLGSWVTDEVDYGKTWIDGDQLWGGLYEWTDAGEERGINSASVPLRG